MEDKPFRVLLDFSEVNPSIYGLKYVWMHVSPRELKTIYDFKQNIIRKFSFNQESFKLFVRDGLLLETEKIAILREDDIVKVQFEVFSETNTEFSAVNSGNNISGAHVSCHSVGSSKSCKRKSETFITASTENDCPSASRSKKKKKRDKTMCEPDETVNLFRADEPSINVSPEKLSGLNESLKPETSAKKHSGKVKKSAFSKTPTSEFIKFAMRLSEPEREQQLASETYVNAANSTSVKDNVTYTNLYKTADLVSKTNLSPIPEQSTYELSNSQTPLNVTETLNVDSSQIDGSTFEEEATTKSGRKKKRRRRKRKIFPSSESLGSNDNLESSFVPPVDAYETSSTARKHIVFRSPTPPKLSTTVTMVSNPESNCEESSVENSVLQGNVELDSSQSTSLKEYSQFDVRESMKEYSQFQSTSLKEYSQFDVRESTNNEMEDSTKESTPFPKKKSKEKSWGVTPLPRIGSTSHSFTMENNEVFRADVSKPAYQDCTPLNCLPPVGTRLAYKTLELNEEYCPEVTDYKEGIITKVNPNTDDLEIELIQEEIKPGRSGKFENQWNDEQPESLVIKTVSLNWSTLIDPRFIPFPNK